MFFTARPRDQTEEQPKATRLVSAEKWRDVVIKFPNHEVDLATDKERDELLQAGVKIETLP